LAILKFIAPDVLFEAKSNAGVQKNTEVIQTGATAEVRTL